MKRALLIVAMGAATAIAAQLSMAQSASAPPAPPPYQMRAPAPAGDRLTGGRDAAALFSNRCGACHLAGGMGTNLLAKQRILADKPAETALLTRRTDLEADYVKTVVRRGKRAMPSLTRVEVTDAELDAIAGYLGRGGR